MVGVVINMCYAAFQACIAAWVIRK